MLTARGFWLLLILGVLTLFSLTFLGYYSPTIAVFSLALLAGFLGEWVWFHVRANSASGRIALERTILQHGRQLPNFWAKVESTVRVEISLNPGSLSLPFVAVADRLPTGQILNSGLRRKAGRLSRTEPIILEYGLHPQAPGVVRFEGVEVRIADYCGFFYRRVFLRVPMEYLALPMLADEEGGQRTTKQLNSLPPPGIHRLRRAGGGTELLDLREYRSGDPPKTIAWKASARRDMLIVKELENDVPVRFTVFLDASNSLRVGEPGDTPLARATNIAAAVSQAASANRDIVGLTVFDEFRSDSIKPARTQIHQMQLLRKYAETAGLQPDQTGQDIPILLRDAHSLGTEMYPELMAKAVNSRPIGLFWLSIFDSRAKWLFIIPILWSIFLFTKEGFNTVIDWTYQIVRPGSPSDLIPFGIIFLLFALTPGIFALIRWFLFGMRGFLPKRAKPLGQRKQIAALFATLDADTAAAVERYISDDDFFANRANRFLTLHRTLPPPQLYDAQGNYRFLGRGKIPILAQTLVRSIGTARDNELFAILADLVELTDDLDPLLRGIRAARARHHQVIVLLPWPADVPAPLNAKEVAPEKKQSNRIAIRNLVEEKLIEGYQKKYAAVRLELVRSGATVVRFNQGDPVQLILQRLEQIRGARIRR